MTSEEADEFLDLVEGLIYQLILRSTTTSGRSHRDALNKQITEQRDAMKSLLMKT